MRGDGRTLVGGLVVLLVAGGPVRSQKEPLSSPLIEREQVQFVSLDLIVHEKVRGKWVGARGLQAEDLVVLVSGKPVELDSFEDFCPAPEETPASAGEPVAAAAMTSQRLPPLRFVLYFDVSHLKLEGFNRSFDAAVTWARETVRPEDEVMVITGGAGLRIVRPLMPAGAGLVEDIQAAMRDGGLDPWAQAEGDGGGGTGRVSEIADLAAGSTGAGGVPTSDTMRFSSARALANSYAQMDFQRARRSVENLESLMSLFDSIEGTKNLLLFQDTLRFQPGAQYPLADMVTDIDVFLRQLVRAANERNVRFYPVVAGGMEGAGFMAGVGSGLADGAMTMLASETGGRVVEGSNDLERAFVRVLEDSSCFYRIGFRLPARHDGDTKRIQVIVRGGWGFRVRHRQTILDRTREQREVDRLRAAFLDPGSAKDLPVEAAAAPLFDHRMGARVRIQVQVPLEQLLALRSDGDSREARVQIGGMVMPRRPEDERGGKGVMSEVDPSLPSWSFASGAFLSIPEAGSGGGRAVALVEEIDAPVGDYWLIGVVEDELAQAVGATVIPFRVLPPGAALGAIHLAQNDTGILFVENEEKDKLRESDPGKKKVKPAVPLLPEQLLVREDGELVPGLAGQLLYSVCDPDTLMPEGGGEFAGLFRGWALHRSLTCGGGQVPVALAGSRLPVPGETCFLVLDSLPPGTLEAGDCTYEVKLERPGAVTESRTLDFHVLRAAG